VPHQVALTVVAPLRAGARSQLDTALEAAGSSGGEAEVPFAQLTGVHFARIFVLDAGVAADGTHTGQKLVWMSDVDAPLERHLSELSELAGPALDRLLCHCEDYPDATDAGGRRAYLDAHMVSAAAAYVNTVGLGLEQVLLEHRLREAIEEYLDDHRDQLSGLDSVAIREEIRRFVAGDETLSHALAPPAPLEPGFRLREIAHMVLIPVLLVLLLPLILVALPFFAILLRIHERRVRTFFRQFFGEMIREHERMSLLGSSYLLLAALIAIEVFPQPVAAVALGYTVLGDAMGALVGRAWGRHRIFNKSWEGAGGCLVACLAWAAFATPIAGLPWPVTIAGAVAATLVEALPIPLDDNLGITLAAGYTMKLLLG